MKHLFRLINNFLFYQSFLKGHSLFFCFFSYLCSMKAELKENGGLPAHILWTLAIVAGISVANLYYNQPLLNDTSRIGYVRV